MFAAETSPVLSACRRGLSALLCALMLLLALGSAEAALRAAPVTVGLVEILNVNSGSTDEPLQPDNLPCHSAHHFCGQIAPLPPAVASGLPLSEGQQAELMLAPERVLQSGPSELPTRPPRA
jgi:hypothetical protein